MLEHCGDDMRVVCMAEALYIDRSCSLSVAGFELTKPNLLKAMSFVATVLYIGLQVFLKNDQSNN